MDKPDHDYNKPGHHDNNHNTCSQNIPLDQVDQESKQTLRIYGRESNRRGTKERYHPLANKAH